VRAGIRRFAFFAIPWLTVLSGCLDNCTEPNPNYCPPTEACADAGTDDGRPPGSDGTADAASCIPELLFQRGDLLSDAQVYRVALTDFVEHPISNGVDTDIDPEWSRDGSRVVLSRNGTSIWIVNVDGSGAHEVDSSSSFLVHPQWSPDDSRIVYVANSGGTTPLTIYSAAAEGTGAPANLTVGEDGQGPLEWAPDGSKLAFISNRTGNLDVFSMDKNGSATMNLTNRTGTDGQDGPVWSPDGTKIVFTGSNRIWIMNADGSSPVNLSGTSGMQHADPIWSPDGTLIYFVADPSTNASLWVMNANGANQHSIDSSADIDLEPVPSPDGSRIAWSSKRDGNFEIYVSDADGSNPVRVTNAPEDDKHPRWRPCN
jgi:Tol biopolymer transport system component